MRHTLTRVALTCASAATMALTFPAADASAEPVDNPCNFTFAKGIYIQTGAVITGGQATCMPKPDSFHIDLRIEYYDGATWVTTANAGDSTRPDPFLNIAARDLECKTMSSYRGHATIWVGAYGGTFPEVDKYTDILNTGSCK
ncbi:hypothetical protein ACQP1O_43065 (plasmid) [Nocardia sp. CA-151230]|uniref:hypothetical protein n=1 Tax=Nocardia sp. CA-151230 TaxID=3239982 RepID=UPI003D8A73F4